MAKETAEQKLLKMMNKSGQSVGAKPSSRKKISFSFSIAAFNKILFVAIIVCVLILLWEMRAGVALLNQPVDISSAVQVSPSTADMNLPSSKSAAYYLNSIQTRDIFRPYEAAHKSTGSNGLAQRMTQYKLVGIAWLDLPETACAMVEDIKTKETHFLKQGEQLDGVTVKTIYTDRVVFSRENEETTIKL